MAKEKTKKFKVVGKLGNRETGKNYKKGGTVELTEAQATGLKNIVVPAGPIAKVVKAVKDAAKGGKENSGDNASD